MSTPLLLRMPRWVWLIRATLVTVGVIPLRPRRPTLRRASVRALAA